MLKRSKYDKLFAVFESLCAQLAAVPDENALGLISSWEKAKVQYAQWLSDPQSGVIRSKVAVGLEQGLRETPQRLQRIAPQWRGKAVVALQTAIENEFPEFGAKQQDALAKVLSRGSIRGESEFYLIRHEVECLEGTSGSEASLSKYYGLLEAYESR
ncbi:hypothetical protein GCM10007933_29220 [Zoogloea oryzae]|uniref:Uncharacterized protein n=1 Tax=Zoogloea oryzae TaxID=310767 RepID=A0ABQ6FEX2_9RHOO|nr:hypothetical protein [Zoogloea oryzae]GLT23456.1 hypothetical protein GCM10007933_29220 [Zoogloea oryzae]